MNKLIQNTQNNLGGINNLQDLKAAEKMLRNRIKVQEYEIRQNLKSLPSEAVKAGAGAVMPSLLTGKTAALALSAGAAIAGGFLARKKTSRLASVAAAATGVAGGWKVAGVTALAQLAFKLLSNRKNKKLSERKT